MKVILMLKKRTGLILVISAPSGSGKTTLCKRFLQVSSSFTFSVSFTTRPSRKNEIEGVDYYFVSEEEFKKMIIDEEFVEWATVHNQLYGTSIRFLEKAIELEKDVILEVDVKGGIQIKKNYPQAILVFLLPPSWQELQKRLKKRGTESDKRIKERVDQAREETKYAPDYQYFIVNNDVNEALNDLLSIIEAERCRLDEKQKNKLTDLLLK